ncbi:MAG: hypothetical protein KAY37_15345, partial [Phycisphaerae bacterium]|nr:hypothetical protein [Phycisphaerae bacterium]
IDLARQAYADAVELRRTVPALTRTDAVAARTAEWLYQLQRDTDPAAAEEWIKKAELAWRSQKRRTPFDVETLLALRMYPGLLSNHIGLLSDALRFGNPEGYWLESLQRLSRKTGFEQKLADLVAATGPITPETDLDTLIASRAPEVHRLAAAWYALQGRYASAAEHAAHAALLYQPMRVRYPKLYSTALAEQADYVWRGSAADAPRAVELLREAIAALPTIQQQHYEDMVRPFQFRLALCLLAAGEVEEALPILRQALGERAAQAEIVEQALQKLMHDAAAGGVPVEQLDDIARRLCSEFPSFCEPTEMEE